MTHWLTWYPQIPRFMKCGIEKIKDHCEKFLIKTDTNKRQNLTTNWISSCWADLDFDCSSNEGLCKLLSPHRHSNHPACFRPVLLPRRFCWKINPVELLYIRRFGLLCRVLNFIGQFLISNQCWIYFWSTLKRSKLWLDKLRPYISTPRNENT